MSILSIIMYIFLPLAMVTFFSLYNFQGLVEKPVKKYVLIISFIIISMGTSYGILSNAMEIDNIFFANYNQINKLYNVEIISNILVNTGKIITIWIILAIEIFILPGILIAEYIRSVNHHIKHRTT